MSNGKNDKPRKYTSFAEYQSNYAKIFAPKSSPAPKTNQATAKKAN